MKHQVLKLEFYKQLNLAKSLIIEKKYNTAFYHLENAHILGQKDIYRHTLSHYWMLIYALKSKNMREFIGQILRILASIFFTLIWVPKGNTGGANISPMKVLPVRKEMKKYF